MFFFSEEISSKMYIIRSRFSKSVLVFFSVEIVNQMSKRKADDSGKRKKYSELTGFSKDITPTRLKTLRSHPHKGDWRKDSMIRIW